MMWPGPKMGCCATKKRLCIIILMFQVSVTRPRHRLQDNIKMNLQKVRLGGIYWIDSDR